MRSRATRKTHYVCQSCGFISPKWLGRCPDCGAWNQMLEEAGTAGGKRSPSSLGPAGEAPRLLAEVAASPVPRFSSGLPELDRVLGGGIIPGSLILVGGDPGIGKSTLLLQTAFAMAPTGVKVLYVSGEESNAQIKMRADRLGASPPDLYILCETRLEAVLTAVQQLRPAVVIADSIQTLVHADIESLPGSVTQVRECSNALLACAKAGGPAVFIVGHVTKEGVLAGPRILEHMVDTVLYFEGERQHEYRILRTVKNRFGPTNEVGIFEMGSQGLIQIGDPSRLFLNERREAVPGSAIAVSLEGTRPLLIEIQSLTATSYFGMPQRRVSGLDYNRCCLLLAVLERRAGLSLAAQDVFLSVAGGLTVNEPAVDLAIIAAAASSVKDKPLAADVALIGEVGLGGEIRPVTQPKRRCQEAAQLGFTLCLLPARDLEKVGQVRGMECLGVGSVQEALARLFS
ncbi:DNA repair protein RadA [candidate division FCPU426 bacterium]|nr:DNA repair protein RadA [candidate division FCPU426 bacterium]